MIIQGDALTVMSGMGAESVQCVVTSPPYWGLRDYGIDNQIGLEATPDAYVQTLVAVFSEVRRVLRDDGTVWLNLGDSYAGGGYSNHANTGGAQRRDGGKQQHTRSATIGLKPKDLIGIPWRVAFALQADGWYLRSDIIWAKGVSFCPAYVGSVMPESCTDRPTQSHEHVFLLTKQARYYYDAEAVREQGSATGGGGWSDRYAGAQLAHGAKHTERPPEGSRNLRNVWAINPQPFSEAHFATFPMALVEPCIKAGSKKGDTVLDPFAGTGTTGIVAQRLGRTFIGIELSETYAQMARDGIDGPLFNTGG